MLIQARLQHEPPILLLRQRRKLGRRAVVSGLVGALGLDAGKREKVASYYHELEVGLLDPAGVSGAVWQALNDLYSANVEALARIRERYAEPSQAVYLRAEDTVHQAMAIVPPPAEPGTRSTVSLQAAIKRARWACLWQTPTRIHALTPSARGTSTIFAGAALPVPVKEIAEDLLGLRVEESASMDCSGMLLPTERRILLNAAEAMHEDVPIRRQRFTIAHEIGHWVCHCLEGAATGAAPSYCRPVDMTDAADRALEREANVFAAELLMPESAIRASWQETHDAEQVASLLDVSQTRCALASLQLRAPRGSALVTEQPNTFGLEDPAESSDTSEEEARELVLRAKEGDVEAAYAVLGRQVAVDVWVAILDQLARDPGPVDLEIVAHRTLRRTPAVVAAVLALARSAGSPTAAFLARVVAEGRSEEKLRADAEALNAELVARFDVEELLAGDNVHGALYALLARPLAEQAAVVADLASDEAASRSVLDAARSEYERLQEVARDSRWRSGSYRHALRHALADLALISGAGGRLEDQAFRLLQLRTEEPTANAELLRYLSPELRARYLDWSLDRSSAESSPARALFAIGQLSVYPEAVERRVLERLLGGKDSQVPAAAAASLVATDPSDGSNDREIAEILRAAEPSTSGELIAALAASASQRLRIDLWPASLDSQVASALPSNGRGCEQLAVNLQASTDPEVRLRLLRILVEAGDTGEAVTRTIATAVVDRPQSALSIDELAVLVDVDWLRAGVWEILDTIPGPVRVECLPRLFGADPRPAVWEQLGRLHARLDPYARQELETLVLEAIADSRLEAQPVSSAASAEFVGSLEREAHERAQRAAAELERLRALIALGDRAAEVELQESLRPLIERAVERSTGNDRLGRDYAKLVGESEPIASLTHEPGAALDDSELAALSSSLEAVGINLTVEGATVSARASGELTTQELIRAFALVDQRVGRAPAGARRDTALAASSAIAAEAARRDAAQEILDSLFERGPLFQAAIALSPDARTAILSAALASGFEPPVGWRDHPNLGDWLVQATDGPSTASVAPSGGSALLALQEIEHERRGAEARLQEGRTAARHAFVAGAATALDDLEQAADTYTQLWLGLGRLGIRRVAALGQIVAAEELDAVRHELIGDAAATTYVVRSGGVEIEGEIVRRARLEGVS